MVKYKNMKELDKEDVISLGFKEFTSDRLFIK